MIIIEDTRQQAKKHELKHKWFAENGIEVVRTKCLVGDYTLPDNQSISIDTKKDMQEIYSNVIQQHKRFTEELKLAQKCNIRLVILVENKDGIKTISEVHKWKNPREKAYYLTKAMQKKGKWKTRKLPKRPPVSSKQLQKAMETLIERYAVEFQFCEPENAGKMIIKILTERGD